MSEDMIAKLAMFCDVDKEAVIQNLTAKSIYQVPQLLEEQHMDDIVLKKLDMPLKPKDMSGWHDMVARILKHYDRKVTIAVAGKYVELQDAYISITESLKHAALHNEAELDIRWVNAEKIEAPGTDLDKVFAGVDGILVPGGFGDRGIEGKISAVLKQLQDVLGLLHDDYVNAYWARGIALQQPEEEELQKQVQSFLNWQSARSSKKLWTLKHDMLAASGKKEI